MNKWLCSVIYAFFNISDMVLPRKVNIPEIAITELGMKCFWTFDRMYAE